MPDGKPPFRADHVGSLLRPAALKEARARHERGEIDRAALTAVEDACITAAIAKQEEVGLNAITDGEYRRAFWHYDFLENLPNVEGYVAERSGFAFKGAKLKPRMLRVIGKLGGFAGHPMLDHFRFVAAHTARTPKMTIPSPSALHFRFGRDAVPAAIYPDWEDFYRDLGETYRKAVSAFYDAGCRYLQLDEVYLAYLCDPEQREGLRQRGFEPDEVIGHYVQMINAAVSGAPDDMTLAMHLCRGNFQSTYVASGGYEPVAERLFNDIRLKTYFMEFDTDRAGGFEPLRFVPKGKHVVLGVVTSKSGTLEHKDAIKRRVEDASRFIDLDQCCLSPQCGFASTEEGNALSEDQQWAKLRFVVETAAEIWGSAG
jgi:5-methyltetrahydropteroyltriglutamate--homocysteine methyltransferase